MPVDLTDIERRKFVAWLHQQYLDSNILADQMEKLGMAGMQQIAKIRRAEAEAFAFVARYIETTEVAAIGNRKD